MGRKQTPPPFNPQDEVIRPLPPMPEPPIALHNLEEHVSITPIPRLEPIIIEFDLPEQIVFPVLVIPPELSMITFVMPPAPQIDMPPIIIPPCPVDLTLPVKPVSGTRVGVGDVVDSENMPFAARPWSPDPAHHTVRCFDSTWRSNGEYDIVNYCLFPTHMELELRKA